MKIVVDEMPDASLECLHGTKWYNGAGDSVEVCCNFSGTLCPGPQKCVYLTALKAPEISQPVTANDYQKACLRTESVAPVLKDNQYARILQGLMGLNGEAGECIDILKKVMFQGHEFDKERLAGELGDVAWYLAISAHALGYDLETIFEKNIDKLDKRYPKGFDPEKSVNRADDDV